MGKRRLWHSASLPCSGHDILARVTGGSRSRATLTGHLHASGLVLPSPAIQPAHWDKDPSNSVLPTLFVLPNPGQRVYNGSVH
jgi:hypothetical protein